MPELPEVETIRRELEPVLIGQQIREIEVLRDKSWQGDVKAVLGSTVTGIKRKAKVLFIEIKLLNGEGPSTALRSAQDDMFLMVHLKMTGQLIYEKDDPPSRKVSAGKAGQLIYEGLGTGHQVSGEKILNSNGDEALRAKDNHTHQDDSDHWCLTTGDRIVGGHPNNSWTAELPDKHTRVIIKLDKGTLYFNDMRVFGWVKCVSRSTYTRITASLPPDIIDAECDDTYFYQILQSSGRAVKLVILDSKKVGGIGNIYANDGLFDAGIDPRRPANTLSKQESNRLLQSLKRVVNLGIELGGATAADGKFVNTAGLGGKYQNHFLVYEQEGKLVEREGKQGVVEKFKLGGRGTYWVSELQF